jgi:hypothetical protein
MGGLVSWRGLQGVIALRNDRHEKSPDDLNEETVEMAGCGVKLGNPLFVVGFDFLPLHHHL